jgi:hypothetical protein
VVSGVTKRTDLKLYPYRPHLSVENVGKIPLEKLP